MARIHIMALRHSAFYTPLLLTIGGGYLEDEGLEPHYEAAKAGDDVPRGIQSGTVHVAQSAVATSFAELERSERPDVVHFAQINERDGFFIVAREADPRFTWDKLAGAEVLVDHFFQPLAMIRFGLDRMGVDYREIRAVDAGGVDNIDRAFRSGSGEYVHLQGPAAQQLEKDGLGYVVAAVGDAVGAVAFSSLCASREWLTSNMSRAFLRAYRKARSHATSTPAEEIAGLLADFFPAIDADVLRDTVAAYQRLGCWTPGIDITRGAYERLLDVFRFSGLITRRHPYEACIAPVPAT
ncbi:MAG: ABC transporter substrate-binding protein [Gammaproteobacteria bacterium]|jgi:NitT/TauT family transport system substrate-binding protein|nr:ABC transporter substrate-binding protein [Gammaproteobacteria bacterium]